MRCSLKGCNSSANKNNRSISFFSFPSDENRRRAWLAALKLDDVNFKKDKVCSIHFEGTDYRPISTKFILGVPNAIRRLNNTAVPMPFSPPTTAKVTMSEDRNGHKITTEPFEQHPPVDDDITTTERYDQCQSLSLLKNVNDNTATSDELYEQRSVTKDIFHENISDELNENCVVNQLQPPNVDVSNFAKYKILMENYLEAKKNLKEARQANQTFVMYQKRFESAVLDRDKQIKKHEDSIKKYEDSMKKYENSIKKYKDSIKQCEESNQELKYQYQKKIKQLENEYNKKIKEVNRQNTSMQKQLSKAEKLLAAKDKKYEELEETVKQIYVQD